MPAGITCTQTSAEDAFYLPKYNLIFPNNSTRKSGLNP